MSLNTLPWYVARASGSLGWALLTASVLWGLVMSTKAKPLGHKPRPAWMLDLHRFLGGLAVIFTAVHVAAILLDSYVHFDLAAVLVPFASTWRPAAVAWGVVGMYLLLAVELTSLARRRMPRKLWRLTHFASFPLFVTATAHGLTAGTDAGSLVFQAVAALAVLGIAGLTALRIRQARTEPTRPVRTPATTAPATTSPERERVAA
jgi:sulfoxide reductase heme-binding subunit YedZ